MQRYIVLFSLLSGRSAMAQDFSVDREIEKIDSLIEYNQFDKAKEKADSLYRLLNKEYGSKKYLEQRLKVRLQQGLIIDNQFNHTDALPLFLEVLDKAEKNKLHRLACRANIRIAFNHEKANNYDLAYRYLNNASNLCNKHKLEDLHSTILIRYALLSRLVEDPFMPMTTEQRQRLLKLGFKGSLESAVHYNEKAIQYAQKHHNEYDLNEAYITMGILFMKKRLNRVAESIAYFLKTIPYWEKTGNYDYAAMMNYNIALSYLLDGDAETALKYNDSGYVHYNKMSVYYKFTIPKQRAKILYALGKFDSAYHYLEIACNDEINRLKAQELYNTKRLEEQYQNDKKEAVIKEKNRQNKIIKKQLGELTKTLEQKQVLLSELQHRVKNNLQHVISILEIQKESVDFNNIDELIRGNQNRIHSMALLHKKLNVAESVNEVDLKRYVTELSELVKDSYDNHKKKITLNIQCDIEKISIEKALPVGLIIVELVSNSMKHAFKKRSIGIIHIEITKDDISGQNKLYYADNGSGFDFNKTSEKGLGMEIIKGLIDQLDGTTESKHNNGFELMVYFK